MVIWLREKLNTYLYLDLLEAELFNDLMANPKRLENLIPKDFEDWIYCG
ncbi:MAG: hypothetical protein AB1397_07435 [bacterium]